MNTPKLFKFAFEDGTEVIAMMCAPEFLFMRRKEKCGNHARKRHNFKPVMDIVQWGFENFKWTNVYRCDGCGEAWAVSGESQLGEG